MSAPKKVVGQGAIEMLPNDQEFVAMDFAARLADGESLVGPPVVTLLVAPSNVPVGAEIAAGAASISGTQVSQLVTTVNAVPGAQYYVDIRCPTNLRTNAGQGPQGKRRIVIIPEG